MPLSRRQALALLGAPSPAAAFAASAEALPEAVIYKNPSCGCCNGWVEDVRRAGFSVRLFESRNIDAVKQRLGVPTDLTSCHTAEVRGYVIEGHLPADAMQRVLSERPPAVGLAVPGMPTGSPEWRMVDPRPTRWSCSASRVVGCLRGIWVFGRSDMRDMMTDGGMWGMGLIGWLIVIVLFLAIAALVKYVFFR
jgi:hypothetical protein